MSSDLSGKRALVTGGTRGIGRAIALRLVAEGAHVTVVGRSSESDVPPECELVAVDFADRAATEEFAGRTATQQVDILVNNAGINRVAPFAEVAAEDFDVVHEVNVRAPFLLCRAVVTGMRDRGWGRIVNVTSVFGVVSRPERAAYSASKFALAGMTTALAVEVAGDGVLANCVAPGFVDTELTRRVLGGEGIAQVVETIPAGRLAHPDEIASLVCWLVSPENTYLTGQNLIIDGGFTRV